MLTAVNRDKREEINIPRKILPSSLHYYGPKYEVLRLKPLLDECLSNSSNLKWPKVDSSYSYFLPWGGDLLTHQSALFQSTLCLFIPAWGTAGELSLIPLLLSHHLSAFSKEQIISVHFFPPSMPLPWCQKLPSFHPSECHLKATNTTCWVH